MKYNLIICDPPYGFNDKLEQSDVARGAAANYSTMSNNDIRNLKIKELADPDGALLALWVPSSLLSFGLELMKDWGFEQKQTYIWVKSKKQPLDLIINDLLKSFKISIKKDDFSFKDYFKNIIKQISSFNLNDSLGFGMGRLFRNTHEICLIGINNKNIYKKLKNKSQRTVSFAPNLKHSSKPEFLQNSLDIMFGDDISKLEIFARRQRNGWVCIGNQAPLTLNQDINESIENLLNEGVIIK